MQTLRIKDVRKAKEPHPSYTAENYAYSTDYIIIGDILHSDCAELVRRPIAESWYPD